MTREQIIILGFIAAAFVAGWLTNALTGLRNRGQAGAVARPRDEALERAIEKSWQELERAMRAYHETVVLSLRGWAYAGSGKATSEQAANRPLAEEVSEALQSDAANDSMLSGVPAERAAALTDLELDLGDWGFTYGVAWALARERLPGEPDEAIAREALKAAEPVFRAYTAGAGWRKQAEEREARRADGAGVREAGAANGDERQSAASLPPGGDGQPRPSRLLG